MAAPTAASPAANTKTTLLACSETRSEREIEDLEAAEVNTASTKTAAPTTMKHDDSGLRQRTPPLQHLPGREKC